MESMGMNSISVSFWQGKRVFLTGHTGFKGGWLALWLQQMGAEVTGYSLEPNTSPSFFEASKVHQGMQSLTGDVRDLDGLTKALTSAKPDIVFHLAAQSLVHYGYKHPVETYATNVMGTVHVLEAVRQTPSVKAVVVVTTDKCYENQEWHWGYRENEPLGGYDPYSSSKGAAELATAAYRTSYFNPNDYAKHGVAIATARAGNVIGGGDWALDRLVPDMVRAISQDQPVLIRRPQAVRPWQHVLEPLAGYLMLAQDLYSKGADISGAYNFGPREQDAQPVQWVVEQVTRFWGPKATWQADTANHPHEAKYLKLDCSKAKAVLGWEPQWDLERTLSEVVAWHKAHIAQENMRQFSLRQVAQFSKLTAP
jgi:CDP-glucose 4,6-dehydratase